MDADANFSLSDCEHETLKRAAQQRVMPFDEERREYTGSELETFGLVREGYNRREMHKAGVKPERVSCFDEIAIMAERTMPLDTPFGSNIRKWQLPIDMMPIRVSKTVFPKNSVVRPHVHPEGEVGNPGGGLRVVTKGCITFDGKAYGPGDWFFVPNGVPYEFLTSSEGDTEVMYTYAFFAAAEGYRFSHPHA